MRGLNRSTLAVALAAALTGVTCAFPTDKSDQVFVTLEAPSRVVLRGEEISVYAQAWHVVGTDTQPITNVDFAFSTGSTSIARVESNGGGYATVTGVNSGNVNIGARAVAFEGAQEADLVLRVSNPLEIDSVRPATAHFGEVLTVYGVGVDSMFLASLSDVNLIEYPFSRLRDPATGLGQISFWVPPPARSAPLFYLGAGVFGFDTVVTDVLKEDVYEPNDTSASLINLDLGGPWPGTIFAPILFTNPALAFEQPDRDREGVDWFKFTRADTTKPTTFLINYPSFGGDTLTRTFLLDSLGYTGTYIFPPSVTFVGSKWSYCKNNRFEPIQVNRESTVVAFKELPSPHISALTFFSNAQRYGITVLDGYLTADSRIKMDRYEENDVCTFADRPAARIPQPAGTPLSVFNVPDTLTIDNAFDIDWYKVTLGAPGSGGTDSSFRVRLKPLPMAVSDSSDIDVYVLDANANEIASGVASGSIEDVTVSLPAGLYYVVVVDFGGVPTRYSMCMSARRVLLGNPCVLIPSPPMRMTPRAPKPTRAIGPQMSAPLGPGESPFGARRRP